MTDEQLDRLVTASASMDDAAVVALDLHGTELTLLEEIMSTPVTDRSDAASEPTTRPTPLTDRRERYGTGRRRLRVVISVAAALAVAAVLAVAVVLPGVVSPDDATSGHSAAGGHSVIHGTTTARFTLAARRVAEANPRLLVDAPGWKVSHVDEFGSTEGEMRFSNGPRELQVDWRRADEYQLYVADRADVSRPRPVRVLGSSGRLYAYSPQDFTVILPVQGAVFLELRGAVGDRSAFLHLLARLTAVDVDTWLAAMPPSVVTPKDVGRVLAQMLADVPLPPGLDTRQLARAGTSDYYQYGARVTGQVACAWIQEWQAARSHGDTAEARKAAAALESSHHWRVLRTMDAQGGYPGVVWEMADQVSSGSVPSDYRQGLGCP